MNSAGYVELINLMKQAVDSDRLAGRAFGVRENDKWCSDERFSRTIHRLADEAKRIGMQSVEIVQGVAGRGQGSGAWTQWEHWDVRKATLTSARTGEVFADHGQNPYNIAFLSAPSPKGGVRAQAVVCDDASRISSRQIDVRGKLVISRGNLSKLRVLTPEMGAAGLIMDGGAHGSTDGVVWLQMVWGCWPTDKRTFAFSLDRATSDRLRAQLAADPQMEFIADVDTQFIPGGYPWVTAIIPGADPKAGEVLAQAHAFEPGILDNASGIGMVWEAARAIQSLIDAGKLPRPLRSYRILSMFECFGFSDFAYQRPEIVKRLVADVNADGVGVRDIESGINRQPLFMPSYLDAEVDPFVDAIHKTSKLEMPVREYRHGNDKILSDPEYGVPTIDFTCDGSSPVGLHDSRDDGRILDVPRYAEQTACMAAMVYRLMSIEPNAVWKREAAALSKPAWTGPGAEIIPARTWPGIPMWENLPTWGHGERILGTGVHRHALLWSNGRRAIGEIAARLEAEGRPSELSAVVTYFHELESVGYCKLRTARS